MSIIKVYVIFYIPEQILYLGKIWFLRYGPKLVQRYGIFKSTISLELNDEKAWFFACSYRFMEINSWLKNIGMGVIKDGCGHSSLKIDDVEVALLMGLRHSNNMEVISHKFTKDHCLWTLWTLTYVDCISFSCIDSFHMAHNQSK